VKYDLLLFNKLLKYVFQVYVTMLTTVRWWDRCYKITVVMLATRIVSTVWQIH